jgi:hypothetical protein
MTWAQPVARNSTDEIIHALLTEKLFMAFSPPWGF